MTKGHWQAATFLLAGLWAMTAAAAYYNRAELRRVTALLVQAESDAARQNPVETRIIYRAASPADYMAPTQLSDKQRCVAGAVLEKTGNEWRNVGRC